MTDIAEHSWSDQVGPVARYFLRRFALAKRLPGTTDAAAYSNALFEVTLVSVLAPILAVYSCALISSLKWAPKFGAMHPSFDPKLTGLIVGFLALTTGGVWLHRRFRSYRENSNLVQKFDTEDARRIVFWQK